MSISKVVFNPLHVNMPRVTSSGPAEFNLVDSSMDSVKCRLAALFACQWGGGLKIVRYNQSPPKQVDSRHVVGSLMVCSLLLQLLFRCFLLLFLLRLWHPWVARRRHSHSTINGIIPGFSWLGRRWGVGGVQRCWHFDKTLGGIVHASIFTDCHMRWTNHNFTHLSRVHPSRVESRHNILSKPSSSTTACCEATTSVPVDWRLDWLKLTKHLYLQRSSLFGNCGFLRCKRLEFAYITR